MIIDHGGESIQLLPHRAAWWARRSTLFIADPHFGKASVFRGRGIPVPTGGTASDLDRLGTLIDELSPQRLVILGDFFHAAESHSTATLDALRTWRQSYKAIHLDIVRGNHDVHAGDPPADLAMAVHAPPLADAPFALLHHPDSAALSLAGHLHPVVVLRFGRGAPLRTPCFWLRGECLILPAFGGFTGGAVVEPAPGDRLFACTGTTVAAVPDQLRAGARRRAPTRTHKDAH